MNNEIIDGATGEIVPAPEGINEQQGSAMVIRSYADIVVSLINQAQYAVLSGRTPKEVIRKRPGKGGKTFSYVPHGYVTMVLNKAFGFAWDFKVLLANGHYYEYHQEQTYTLRNKQYTRPASVTVYGEITVRLHNPDNPSEIVDTIIKGATGEREDSGGMSMGSMIKAAESDALKKAASKLGVALDLYFSDAEQDLVESDPRLARVRSLQSEGKTASEIADLTGISKADVRNLME